MKPHLPCALFGILSIAAYGQQVQVSPSSAVGKPAANDLHDTLNNQPFLHGESGGSLLSPATRVSSNPDDVREQLESLKTYIGERRGLIEIPPNAPAGWWEGIGGSNVRFLDDRGNSMPNAWGGISRSPVDGFKIGYANGLMLRATETDPGSPVRYTGFVNMEFHYTAAQGGVNSYNGKIGTKTDYFNVLATSEMRSVGQKSGIASQLASFSNGDTMGIQTNITQFGGFDTSGDEQTEGVRVQIQQGSSTFLSSGGVFEGMVKAISGKTLVYSASRDERTLGEHRIIRDLDRLYDTGSIVSVVNSGGSPNTVRVTGSGTHWSELGSRAHTRWNDLAAGGGVTETNLAFCFDPLKSDGYDVCFPVSEIVDDDHLTLNLLGFGTQENTPWPSAWPISGGYRIYGAAWPTSIDLAAHTITAPDLSGITAGHKIDQVLAYNTQIFGQWISISRHIGLPGKGGGLYILNWGAPQSPRMGFGIGVSGGFDTAIAFQNSNQRSGVPSYLASFYNEPESKILFDSTVARAPAPEVGLWRLRDAAGATHVMLSFLRDTATTCVLDTSLCVSASGAVAAERMDQIETNDYAGTINFDGGTAAKVDFKQPFHRAPVCSLTPTSDPSDVGAYWVSASNSSVTAHTRRAGKITFNFVCVGNPD